MNSKILLSIPLVFVALLILYGFGGQSKWPGGSPGGYTGSPGDGKDCTQCHGGSASLVLGWISSDIPAEGYLPGETYTIFIDVSGSGDKGFEVSPQADDGSPLGIVHDGTGVHLVNGNKAVTQDNATSANPAQWQFEWTAPAAGTGAVTFYGAFTVNKPVTKLCTYVVQENTGISIAEQYYIDTKIYPNPVTDRIRLSLLSKRRSDIRVSLVALNGQSVDLLYKGQINEGEVSLDLRTPVSLKPGVYILRIQNNDFVSNSRVLILP